jgi:YVTN family beta-propeller protein
VTPDGAQVWAGNTLTGSLSVISTATNTLVTTIPGGPGTSALNSAPTDIVFGPAG